MTGARINPWNVRALGWVLVYLALAGTIGQELDWGRRIHPSLPVPKPAPAARVDSPIQPGFTLLALEQGFAETMARPVFTAARQPPPPPASPAPPKPAMQKGQFVLLGALITRDNSVALLRDVATGKTIRVEQGKEIRGIMVTNVFPERVTLTQYDDSEELMLKIQSARPPAAAQVKPVPPIPPAATPAAPAPAVVDENARSLINSRRASHGLPPL